MRKPIEVWDRIRVSIAGCWEWTGSVSPEGYGRLNKAYTHREVYTQLVGPIEPGLHIDHLCRNRICCNPDHLEPVTPAENARRGMAPGAIVARTGRCKRGHDLTVDGRSRISAGGNRRCKECDYEREAGGPRTQAPPAPCRHCSTLVIPKYSRPAMYCNPRCRAAWHAAQRKNAAVAA